MKLTFYALVLNAFLAQAADLQTVESVDLQKYLGEWQEVMRIPNSFQDNKRGEFGECFNTVAKYGALEGGKISVENTCYRFDKDGKSQKEVARAIGKTVQDSSNSKLEVNFTGLALLRWLGIGTGDYWIVGLGPVNAEGLYSWALVGSPSRKYGWVLVRKPLEPAVMDSILALAEAQGYRKTDFVLRTR